MAKFVDNILSDKPKTIEKMAKAFEKGGCSQYMDALIADVKTGTGTDFGKIFIYVTDNFVVDYTFFMRGLGNTIKVVPINMVVNAYRSNIDYATNKYSYDYLNLSIETSDGQRVVMGNVYRTLKTGISDLDNAANFIKGKVYGGAS